MKSWKHIDSIEKTRLLKKYARLLVVNKKTPKQAYNMVFQERTICRKTLYNWINKYHIITIQTTTIHQAGKKLPGK